MKRRELQREIRDESGIRSAVMWAEAMTRQALAAGPVVWSLTRQRRTLDQNAKLWPMLADVSKQVDWYGQKLTKEEWKDVFTAGLKQQRAVPGLDGGFVILGAHTSRMSKRDLSELVELIFSFGAEHEVQWSEPAKRSIHELKEVA